MTIVESFLLAIALCADTLAVSTAGGLKYRMSWQRWLILALVLGGFQGLFPLMGALLGSACDQFIEAVDHWIAFALLLLIGSKMVFDALSKHKNKDGNLHLTSPDNDANSDKTEVQDMRLKVGTMCLLGIATSIDAFAVGVGFGLDCSVVECFITCAIIALVTFLVALLGITLGKAGHNIPERWTGIIAGLVLIGIGAKILIEHLSAV